MAKTLLLVATTPASTEVESEYNRWYEETHIPELKAAIPSITVVNRYRLHPAPGSEAAAPRYLAVYELDEDDAGAATAALFAALPGTTPSDTIDLAGNPPTMEFYSHL